MDEPRYPYRRLRDKFLGAVGRFDAYLQDEEYIVLVDAQYMAVSCHKDNCKLPQFKAALKLMDKKTEK
jgi:16S rRNA G1207 methylase RsmC